MLKLLVLLSAVLVVCSAQSCTNCQIDGRTYRGGSNFRFDRGCYRFSCYCNCDGSWNCPGRVTTNKCTGGGNQNASACGNCQIDGRTYRGGSNFQLGRGGNRFSCECNCEGSYYCRLTTNKSTGGGNQNAGACGNCQIDGRTYRGGSNFQLGRGGNRFSCECNCEGSYYCRLTTNKSTGGGNQNAGACGNCQIDGRTYRGGSNFQLGKGGNRFSCECNCEGSYYCRLTTNKSTGGGNQNAGACGNCQIDGRTYRGGSNFQLGREGNRFSCKCNCEGSYYCRLTTNKSTGGGNQNAGACGNCQIDGRTYKGGSNFQLGRGGNRFSCECNCEGSYYCRLTTNKSTGGGNQNAGACGNCQIDGRTYRGGSNFRFDRECYRFSCFCNCDGSWNCPGRVTTNKYTGGGNQNAGACGNCQIDGRTYRGSSNFQLGRGGNRFSCECNCEGSYYCRLTTNKSTGGGNQNAGACGNCQIDGRTYRGGSNFRLGRGCYRFSCYCNCDGSWNCPGRVTTNKCTGGGNQNAGACGNCQIDGRTYRGGSNFQLRRGGNRFSCVCNCEGSYYCRLTTNKSTGGGNQNAGACGNCQIDGRTYRGGSNFQLSREGNRFSCKCNCEGSYYCRLTTNKSTGGGNQNAGACGNCQIDGRTYRGGSNFQLGRGGNRFSCECNCEGSYYCRLTTNKSTGGGNQNAGACGNCQIDGRTYRGGSNFQLGREGNRFSCECNCEGSYYCRLTTNKSTGGGNQNAGACGNCQIDGRTYRGGSNFQLGREGNRFSCKCNCEGSYYCRLTTNKSTGGGNQNAGACGNCQIDGRTYRGGSNFQLGRGGNRFSCECNCEGFYYCRLTTNKSTGGGNQNAGACGNCQIDGRTYRGGSNFQLGREGNRFSCKCNCKGSYYCRLTTNKSTGGGN
ncbi:kielin/chordin-like protein [Magallana gigas]|uniref:kielin/chordin-like protein n=1 Tax=Magallana gigas TaxID=29159 RepID=UPI0033402164